MTPTAPDSSTPILGSCGEALADGLAWTPEILAAKFVEVFQRDPRPGYAGGFQRFLEGVTDGSDFLARIRPDSDKSGAAMRACPVGTLPDLDEVLDRIRVQAAITHDTPDGIAAACAAALMPHYFLYGLGPRPTSAGSSAGTCRATGRPPGPARSARPAG